MFLSHFAVVLLRHFVTGFRVQSLLTAGKKEQEDVNPCRNKTVVGCLVKFFVDFWHGVITFSPVFCFKGNVFKESHTVNFVENPQQCLQKKKVIPVYLCIYNGCHVSLCWRKKISTQTIYNRWYDTCTYDIYIYIY